MERLLSFFKWLAKGFFAVFYQIFGSFSWKSPPWLKRLRRSTQASFKSNPWRSLGWTACIIALCIFSAASFYIQDPLLVYVQITPPRYPLEAISIDFVRKKGTAYTAAAAAPIQQFGKSLETGIKMTPPLPGKWQWLGDSQLRFGPLEDWPAGQTFRIAFDKSVFDNSAKMKAYHAEFSTPPLSIDISDLTLYQDLKNPHVHKIVGSLELNFPVEAASLHARTRLMMQDIKNGSLDLSSEDIPLKITYDNSRLIAYIESAPIMLPAAPSFANLLVEKGVKALKGPSVNHAATAKTLFIPGAESFLQIKNASACIQRDAEDNPEQVLHIETTAGMRSDDLLKYLRVSILPKDYPATPFRPVRKNYAWSKPGEVTPEVLKAAIPVELVPLPEEHPFPSLHHFKLQVQAPSNLFVEIAKGAPGMGGFCLANDYKTVLQTPDYPQEIHFLHKGSLMVKSGEKKITVGVRGIQEVKFSICQILPHHVNHLVTQTYGDLQNPQFLHKSFGHEAISQIFTEFRQFNLSDPCACQYTSIDLERYLGNNQNALGLFLLKAQGWDGENHAPAKAENDRLILITDMDLIVKDNADGTHDLFVQSISEGQPVASAEVSVLGKNSLPIVSAPTDADGHVVFPKMDDFKDDREPVVYLVRKGDDLSFIPYQHRDRELNYTRFDTDGVISMPEDQLSAYLFTDRGIYRPGDQIHMGAIVKNRFAQNPAHGLPLEIVLTDPQGAALFNQKISLPPSHFFAYDYTLPDHAPSGNYHINLYAAKDQRSCQHLGGSALRVEEFLPDRLKIDAHLGKDAPHGWIAPEGRKAKINLWNLFGAAAAHHKVKGKMVIAAKWSLHLPGYESYRFADPLPRAESNFFFSENFSDVMTDANGDAEFDLQLERFSKGTYQLNFIAEGFESSGGRSVSAEASALVTPHKFLVGCKADGDLDFLKQHAKERVHFIAIDAGLQPISLNLLQAQLYRVQTASNLVKKSDGTYGYQSQRQKIPLSSDVFKISTEGSDYVLPTDYIGDFALALYDPDGNLLNEVPYSVVGENSNPTLESKELKIKLNKTEYEAGDTVELHISAPYVGAGLLTIERDRVYAYKWFKADSTSSIQTITIPPEFMGNGYVNVAFVRAWDSDEIYMNPLSYAAVPFHVSREKQCLHINLEAPDFVLSGGELSIRYSSDHPSKIVIFAVDEGILSIDGYQTPDPLGHFFRKSALMVKTTQIADLILPKESGKRESSSTGGDKRAKLLAMNFNPFKRKTERAVVFWSGILDSSTVSNTETYQVPDYYNGSLRVMAVAVAPDRVGSAEKNIQAQSHFIIHPSVPLFMAPGDTATVTAAVFNSLLSDGDSEPILVSAAASPPLAIIGPTEVSLAIPQGQERQASFKIRANEILGGGELTFTAKRGDKSSKITSTLAVRPACTYQTKLISGHDNSSGKTIHAIRRLYPQQRLTEATASTNPLILAHGLKGYIDHYPYDSTEKLISQALAQLAMAKQPFFQLDPLAVQKEVRQTLQTLRERQLSCGGFSCWPSRSDCSASQPASILAMDYLTEAKLSGYAVPEDLFDNGIQYLESVAKGNAGTLPEARMQASAIYILTRNGIVTTNYLTNLQLKLAALQKDGWFRDIAGAYMAATHQLLQSRQAADLLISKYQIKQGSAHESSDFDDRFAADAQYMTLLSRHFPGQLTTIRDEGIMALVKGISEDQLSSRSAAYAVQALSAFSQTGSEDALRISEVKEGDKEAMLISSSPFYQKAAFSAEAKALRFYNPAEKTYFYQINQTGFDRSPPEKPIKNGLEIFREYRDSQGQAIQSAQLGETIEAHIKARALTQSLIRHVAIVDMLPGGFRVDPQSLAASDCDYVDVREDRIIFYCSLLSSAAELSYRLQAVNRGEYSVPPIFAQAMYQPLMQAQGLTGHITVR